MTRRTLLGVWAHPDDEAFLSAGLMLDFTARGDRVVVVTATPGEHGTDDPDRWPPRRLASRRRRELRRSLAYLGVHEHHILGFEDGSCERGDGTEALVRCIEQVRPDVIVTFGPEGMTGHWDHQAVSNWTTDAWRTAGAGAELWYATVTPEFHQQWGRTNAQVGFWYEHCDPPETPSAELRHSIALAGDRLDRKVAALRAHRSQTAKLEAMIGSRAFRDWWSVESFRSAGLEAAPVRDHERERVGVRLSSVEVA